ncbi:hypothetical protein [Pseudomonas sp. Marseille-Q5115]|uniref:hypothetical protein n=1 Tax=Pseudomonas sp. Marseille-Q5115 TaxID=2866593 RepID=UPI001CE3FDBA|nr:hypothetical protein [Pseudomonas sp. Marseille-Q5115]
MKIFGSDNSELMAVNAIERSGNELLIKGKIFGAMPMVARLRPEEARAALKMLDLKTMLFLLSLVFRARVGKMKFKAGSETARR